MDYESLEGPQKDTVTIRERDSGDQKRIPVAKAAETINGLIAGRKFSDL